MAKSLRSKKQQENKILKRQSVFGAEAKAREARIAERLHQAAIDEILAKQQKPADRPADRTADGAADEPADLAMEVDASADAASRPAKKSTGGWSKRKGGRKSRKSRKSKK